jgi:hypothetical protein
MCVYVYVYVYVHVFLYVCFCAFVCVFVYLCVFVSSLPWVLLALGTFMGNHVYVHVLAHVNEFFVCA